MTNFPNSLPATQNCETFWVQFDSTGNLCLRIITKEEVAPHVMVEQVSVSLIQRAAPTASFPVTIWETPLPIVVETVEVEGVELSLSTSFKKIAFIGDTGCRPNQGCDPSQWPFQEIAERILADKPDLIIHLGDYIYRHQYAQQKYCSQHIHFDEGDNWLGWQKEFFAPLANVLPFIPWTFIRGNQESHPCASEGWRRFLDGYPYHEEEVDYDAPYVIALDKVNLIVHDSSCIASDYQQILPEDHLKHLTLPSSKPAWLLTHRPLWGIVNDQKHNEGTPLIILNEHGTLQHFLKSFPETLTAIFSGHIHAFEIIKLSSSAVYQFVIGNGGVALEEDCPPEVLRNTRLEDQRIEEALALVIFGYGLAEHNGGEWKLAFKDTKGEIIEAFSWGAQSSLVAADHS